jgi:tRNA-2-methylthio-N6-dimethylallyladenosine synthase
MTDNEIPYSSSVQNLLKEKFGDYTPKAFVHTFGCQQNVNDGEKIKGVLQYVGYDLTDDAEKADFILYNTCAVREHAELKVFGYVGKLKKLKEKNENLIIAVCGCMTEQEHIKEKFKKSYPYVSLVFGTRLIHRLPEFIYRYFTTGKRVYELKAEDTITENLPIHRDKGFKAWLPIMYGCNNFCTYCIVPYVRGRERSRKVDDILKEATDLVNAGYKDITLLGQNVNSYDSGEGVNFAGLLEKINNIDGDFIIRFMTSHPKDCSKELIDTVAKCDKVAKHIHLPVQSGNNNTLKRMNRKYTRESYLSLAKYAKSKIENLSMTSDIIVGFPGETYEEFKDTLSLVKEVGYSSLFTFIYSKRNGTPAAQMDDPIPHEEKTKWFEELLSVQNEKSSEYTESLEGKIFRVLVDERNDKNGLLHARTDGNIIVELQGDDSLIGQFIYVKIIKALTWIVKGEIVNK